MVTKFSEDKKVQDSNNQSSVDLELITEVRLILEGIGRSFKSRVAGNTASVAEMYAELTAGMHEDPQQHVVPLPGDKHDEMVIVEDIKHRVALRASSRPIRR